MLFTSAIQNNLCELFTDISRAVWHKISQHHNLGIRTREETITNDILFEIRRWAINNGRSISWADYSKRESRYGNDFDLLIKNQNGEFDHFAFQAKILKIEGNYTGLDNGNGKHTIGEFQWDKLKKYSEEEGCFPYYILYNGIINEPIIDLEHGNCTNSNTTKDLGCSLLYIDLMKREWDFLNRRPSFNDFHYERAVPLNQLVCCDQFITAVLKKKYPEVKSKNKEEAESFFRDFVNKYKNKRTRSTNKDRYREKSVEGRVPSRLLIIGADFNKERLKN